MFKVFKKKKHLQTTKHKTLWKEIIFTLLSNQTKNNSQNTLSTAILDETIFFLLVRDVVAESCLSKKIGWPWSDEIIHLNIFRLYLSFSMKRRHYLYRSLLTFLNLKGGDISKASVHCRNRSSLEEPNCLYTNLYT